MTTAKIWLRPAAILALPLCALVLSGCVVSQSTYDQSQANLQQAQANNQRLQAENASLKTQIAQDQEQHMFTVAADVLFPSGGFEISANGHAMIDDIAGKLKTLRNSKIVVYGYTDNAKVGAALRKAGVKTNVDLSSRRADAVVNLLVTDGVNPNIISAKGRGDTHPVAPNTTAEGRSQNRRIEIAVEGPGN